MPGNRFRSAALRVLALLAVACGVADGNEPPRVLLLFSNDRLLPANLRFDEGIRQALDPQGNQTSVTFFAEFLDAIRLGGEERERAMAEYFGKRYRGTEPDVLVALGPQALAFFVAHRDTLFPGKPLIFGGTSVEQLDLVKDVPNVAGLPMELTVAPVVKALLEMRPATKELLLVHGTSEFDRNWRDTALRQCEPFKDRLKITECPELPLPELKDRLGKLSPESGVLYLSYFQSPTGETYTPARLAGELASASSAPIIGPYDTYLGSGVLGVSVSPFLDEGVAVGKLIRWVLSGEKPEAIGILPANPPRLILDARQVKRWGIETVPQGAELHFVTAHLWQQHRAAAGLIIAVVVLQAIMISGLVIARLRQKRAERELRQSDARFADIFRCSPVAMGIVRQSDGKIVDVNPEWETVTAISRGEAIGRTPVEAGLLADDNADQRLRQFLKSGKPLDNYEHVHRAPDGHMRWLSLSTELMTLREEACFIVVAKDVTEFRESEKARQQLAHTSRLAMLGEMTASIAHEINQPLAAILSNTDAAEMLLARATPPLDEVKQILTDIRRDDRRASEVIKRVRSLVGHREIQPVPLDLNDLIRDTTKLVAHEAQRRGVTVVQELSSELPLVHGDPVQVEQVLINLLLNAMDAMKGTPMAERTLSLRSWQKDANSVMMSVEDRGHGIPEEDLDKIFDSFFTTKQNGMGLGLALARSIVELHSGSLSAKNNASTGATFYLMLPTNVSSLHEDNGNGNTSRPSDR